MRKTFWLLMLISMFIVINTISVSGQINCDLGTTTDTTALTNLLNGTAQTVLDTDSEWNWEAFLNITPTGGFNVTNFCENLSVNNRTVTTLKWVGINGHNLTVANASNIASFLSDTNYTFYPLNGSIIWLNLTNVYNNTFSNVYVCYNKTLSPTFDFTNTNFTFAWTDSGTGFGVDHTLTLLAVELNGTNWTTYYTYTNRTCAARDSCRATQLTIYSGFGLLAVAVIILAAFVLINMFQGGAVDMASMGAVAILVLGLGIVLMIAFVIIDKVGASICGVP